MSVWALSTLQRIIRDLDVYQDGRQLTGDTIEAFIVALERDLIAQQALNGSVVDRNLEEGSRFVQITLEMFKKVRDEVNNRPNSQPFQQTGDVIGRPKFNISYEQLSFLIENRFTVPQIADMVGISVRTVYRRLVEYSLSQYSDTSDNELDSIVKQVHSLFPMCGNSQMQGHLLARGLRVQQLRIRESQRRVDPEGCAMRRLSTINRRQYSVPSPRSLYHMDGNHKLIRYLGWMPQFYLLVGRSKAKVCICGTFIPKLSLSRWGNKRDKSG